MARAIAAFSAFLLILAVNPLAADSFPLPAPAVVPTNEASAPFVIPDGFEQHLVVNRVTLNALGLPATFSTWDMIALDPTSRFIFVPCEAGEGAGVFRYDTLTGRQVPMLVGNATGVRTADPKDFDPKDDDFSRFDPATYTPWDTVLVGEETTGGRLFEIATVAKFPLGLSPQIETLLPGPTFHVTWKTSIPAVAHEGLRFDSEGTLYFIDEDNSGSFYKFVPVKTGSLAKGQTFVLKVSSFTGNPAENWNSATNITTVRSGPAVWVPITDAQGNALTVANPFAYGNTTGGRTAADEVGGTPFGRPEDMDFHTLANGNDVFYCTVTSEQLVVAVELVSGTSAIVHDFVRNSVTLNESTGLVVGGGSAGFTSPDNIAMGHDGTVYIIEDNNPGDIWRATDSNDDGVAESVGRWASLGVTGSEPTGMIADPNDSKRFFVVIQHPSSDNDAIWEILVP